MQQILLCWKLSSFDSDLLSRKTAKSAVKPDLQGTIVADNLIPDVYDLVTKIFMRYVSLVD